MSKVSSCLEYSNFPIKTAACSLYKYFETSPPPHHFAPTSPTNTHGFLLLPPVPSGKPLHHAVQLPQAKLTPYIFIDTLKNT